MGYLESTWDIGKKAVLSAAESTLFWGMLAMPAEHKVLGYDFGDMVEQRAANLGWTLPFDAAYGPLLDLCRRRLDRPEGTYLIDTLFTQAYYSAVMFWPLYFKSEDPYGSAMVGLVMSIVGIAGVDRIYGKYLWNGAKRVLGINGAAADGEKIKPESLEDKLVSP